MVAAARGRGEAVALVTGEEKNQRPRQQARAAIARLSTVRGHFLPRVPDLSDVRLSSAIPTRCSSQDDIERALMFFTDRIAQPAGGDAEETDVCFAPRRKVRPMGRDGPLSQAPQVLGRDRDLSQLFRSAAAKKKINPGFPRPDTARS